MSKPSSFSRLALPIFRGIATIIAALIGGLLGVFGFVHVVSMDNWVTTYLPPNLLLQHDHNRGA